MKTNHDEQRELLEDIFTPDAHSRSVSAAEVMKLVETERRSRSQRRRGIAMAAAVILGLAGVWISIQPSTKPEATTPPLAQTAPKTPAPAVNVAAAAITPPKVEHVDDEGMLAMLGKQPTALVRWPDGRQSLLLLVATPPK